MARLWLKQRIVDWLLNPERTNLMIALYQEPKGQRGYPDTYNASGGLYFNELSGMFYRVKDYEVIQIPTEDVISLIDASIGNR